MLVSLLQEYAADSSRAGLIPMCGCCCPVALHEREYIRSERLGFLLVYIDDFLALGPRFLRSRSLTWRGHFGSVGRLGGLVDWVFQRQNSLAWS